MEMGVLTVTSFMPPTLIAKDLHIAHGMDIIPFPTPLFHLQWKWKAIMFHQGAANAVDRLSPFHWSGTIE
jgi:hypothetical protein